MGKVFTVKLYLHLDKDADLIRDWNIHLHQEKSETIKEYWRRAIKSPDEQKEEFDWGKLRGIIEATLDSRGVMVGGRGAENEGEREDPLDRLDDSLLLD